MKFTALLLLAAAVTLASATDSATSGTQVGIRNAPPAIGVFTPFIEDVLEGGAVAGFDVSAQFVVGDDNGVRELQRESTKCRLESPSGAVVQEVSPAYSGCNATSCTAFCSFKLTPYDDGGKYSFVVTARDRNGAETSRKASFEFASACGQVDCGKFRPQAEAPSGQTGQALATPPQQTPVIQQSGRPNSPDAAGALADFFRWLASFFRNL